MAEMYLKEVLTQLCTESDFSHISESKFIGIGVFSAESVKEVADSD